MSRKSKVTLETVNDSIQILITKVGGLETRFGGLETRFGGLETRVDGLDAKTDSIQADVRTLQQTVNRISIVVAEIPEIKMRLSAIEADINAIKVRLDNLDGLYQHLTKKVDILYDEYYAMRVGLERNEQRLDRQEAQRLADRVQLLEQKVAALEKETLN